MVICNSFSIVLQFPLFVIVVQLSKFIEVWNVYFFSSGRSYLVIKAKEIKLVNKLKRGDGMWTFACGNVLSDGPKVLSFYTSFCLCILRMKRSIYAVSPMWPRLIPLDIYTAFCHQNTKELWDTERPTTCLFLRLQIAIQPSSTFQMHHCFQKLVWESVHIFIVRCSRSSTGRLFMKWTTWPIQRQKTLENLCICTGGHSGPIWAIMWSN